MSNERSRKKCKECCCFNCTSDVSNGGNCTNCEECIRGERFRSGEDGFTCEYKKN